MKRNAEIVPYLERVEATFGLKEFSMMFPLKDEWMLRLLEHVRKNEHYQAGFILAIIYQEELDNRAAELKADEEFETKYGRAS